MASSSSSVIPDQDKFTGPSIRLVDILSSYDLDCTGKTILSLSHNHNTANVSSPADSEQFTAISLEYLALHNSSYSVEAD